MSKKQKDRKKGEAWTLDGVANNGSPFVIIPLKNLKSGHILNEYTECCDCGLTHLHTYEVAEDRFNEKCLFVETYRDSYETHFSREKRNISGIKYKRKKKSK